jgi:hypothetical protein
MMKFAVVLTVVTVMESMTDVMMIIQFHFLIIIIIKYLK